MALAQENPFQWLIALEQAARQHAVGLPRQEKVQKIWHGISFRLGRIKLVAPLTEIREVLHCPKTLARVPGAKNWVKGIANIRGLLLPVIDLQACLGGEPITLDSGSRLLIINQVGVSSGILVDEVMGIKHFLENTMNQGAPEIIDPWCKPFTRGNFIQDGETWAVMDMLALSNSHAFLNAAR